MRLELAETILRWMGGLLAIITLGVLLYGIWRGTRRPAGRTTGRAAVWLRSLWFYLAATALFLALCYFGWRPIPLTFTSQFRVWLLALGALLYFSGMAFTLWGRLALGKNYFVSSALGAQVLAGQQLVTSGPFAIVRHPMYCGLMVAAVGSLLLYHTWTTLFFACAAPLLTVRARHEEQVLATEFGEQWQAYCRRVPAFLPRRQR